MRELTDPLLAGLAGLASPGPPPGGFADRVVGRYLLAPSRIGDVHVAVTDRGVAFVRDARSMDAAGFGSAYRQRFARPLLPGGAVPPSVLQALGLTGPCPPLDLRGLSPFEQHVLLATTRIPFGTVRTFGWVAAAAGHPGAAPAVSAVLARNAVPLLVPCHRVVHADGRVGHHPLGPSLKEELLRAEGTDVTGAGPGTVGIPGPAVW